MADEQHTQARIAELEMQLAFQDDLLQSLNKVVVHQEERLVHLEQQLRSLREEVSAMVAEPAKSNTQEPPPPHY